MSDILHKIQVVLVHPSHPGNIGAVARAMKTMGLQNLTMVQPKAFPHPEAEARAKQANDILAHATVVETLQEAIKDCAYVVGTSARPRTLAWPIASIREAAREIIAETANGSVAILFGRESVGLTNDELQLCHQQIYIPANPVYSSLNIASAVQLISYEIYANYLNAEIVEEKPMQQELATMEDLAGLYSHLEQVLAQINFIDPARPGQMMARLQRLFNRARLDKIEINILRGMLKAMQGKTGRK